MQVDTGSGWRPGSVHRAGHPDSSRSALWRRLTRGRPLVSRSRARDGSSREARRRLAHRRATARIVRPDSDSHCAAHGSAPCHGSSRCPLGRGVGGRSDRAPRVGRRRHHRRLGACSSRGRRWRPSVALSTACIHARLESLDHTDATQRTSSSGRREGTIVVHEI